MGINKTMLIYTRPKYKWVGWTHQLMQHFGFSCFMHVFWIKFGNGDYMLQQVMVFHAGFVAAS